MTGLQRHIEIMDTTLRDGEQTSGVSFSSSEKLTIAQLLLTEVKVDRIEIASARVSEGEFQTHTPGNDKYLVNFKVVPLGEATSPSNLKTNENRAFEANIRQNVRGRTFFTSEKNNGHEKQFCRGPDYNPNETLIFRELAWHFQHKMGQNLDDANMYYKQQWANEMSKVFDKKKPNLDELIHPTTADATNRARLCESCLGIGEQYRSDMGRHDRRQQCQCRVGFHCPAVADRNWLLDHGCQRDTAHDVGHQHQFATEHDVLLPSDRHEFGRKFTRFRRRQRDHGSDAMRVHDLGANDDTKGSRVDRRQRE